MRTAIRCGLSITLGLCGAVGALQAQGEAKPRVIVLAFDGADHGMTQEYIDRGELPNLKALSESGSFSRLETTNPAESAVSWSCFGRGLNPGNTNMHGFVGRKSGSYFPELRLMKSERRPYSDFYDEAPEEAGPASTGGGEGSWLAPAGAFVVGLILAVLLGKAIGASGGIMLLLIVLLGGGSAGVAMFAFGGSSPDGEATLQLDNTPSYVNTLLPVVEGDPLWQRLDRASVRVKGFLVPMSAPIAPLEHGQMLGGLGVPDVSLKPIGAYYIFSTSADDVAPGEVQGTASAGKMIGLSQKGDAYVAWLPGPKDPSLEHSAEQRVAELDKINKKSNAEKAELSELKDRIKDGFETRLEVTVRRAGADAVEVTIGDEQQTVAAGDWSDWMPVQFPTVTPGGAALARFRVVSAGDVIKLFFSPLGYDPRAIPAHMQIEYPSGFAKRIAEEAGLFDTTGWACVTNPLKDVEIDEQVFLENIENLTEERSRVIHHELAKDDYDFFFAMFGETDRVQHLMYRLIDEQNPMYDAGLVDEYGSAILDVYKVMDKIVGDVMEKFVDERTTLFVISDHGFTSFRRQMALNTWLMEEGYLVARGGVSDPKRLINTLSDMQSDYLIYMDPKKSRAFALGLGKIYINLRGREKNGIVDPADYDALCDEIKTKLLAYRDPKTGDQVVQKVERHDEVYSGDHADEDADLYLGFAEYYRVSWSTTTGSFSAEVIEDNDSKWSGDHASNDPDVVPGILFSSRRLVDGQRPGILDMTPSILGIFGAPTDGTDGRVLAFQ